MTARLAPPVDLTVPRPGSTTLRDVLSAALSRLLGEIGALRSDDRVEQAALRSLVHARSRDPRALGPLVAALRRPTVGTLARCLRTAAPGAAPALRRRFLATLAVELAALGALDEPVTVPAPPERMLSLVGRFAIAAPVGATAVTVARDAAVFDTPAGAVRVGFTGAERPYHPLPDGPIVLALADDNPLATFELHPDKSGNAIDLGGRPVDDWTRALGEALAIVREALPDLHREIELVVHQFVPVGFDPERHLSASYQEALGTVYLTLHPRPMVMAEAIVHEASHNKLNALFERDPVLDNAFTSLHASPVRPDPRPLHGILLAVHAFVPVERMYERLIAAGHPLVNDAFRARYQAIREKNRRGAAVLLTQGEPSALGRGVVGEIAEAVGMTADAARDLLAAEREPFDAPD